MYDLTLTNPRLLGTGGQAAELYAAAMSQMASENASSGGSVLSCEELLLSRFEPGSAERTEFGDFIGGEEASLAQVSPF